MAERGGFEPPIPAKGITVFETAAFDHSATSPLMNGALEAPILQPYGHK